MANKKISMGKMFTNSSVPIYNKLILVYFTITASNGDEFIYTVYKIITALNGEEFIYTVYKIITSDCLVSIIYLH